jgi:hypothetical protein
MLKSDPIRRIASQNPHLMSGTLRRSSARYSTKSSKLCIAVIESSCGVLERFQLSSEGCGKDAIRALALSSRSQRKPFPSSKRERKCARGLIAKPCRANRQLPFPPKRKRNYRRAAAPNHMIVRRYHVAATNSSRVRLLLSDLTPGCFVAPISSSRIAMLTRLIRSLPAQTPGAIQMRQW